VSNFPLSYRLSWLPRFLKPSLSGEASAFAPSYGRFLPQATHTARLVFLGDISAVANREPPDIDPEIRTIIASGDLVVANCESPVVGKPRTPLATRFGTRHAMTSKFLDGAIAAAGIDPHRLVLSLANNHILDQGVAGFEETVSALGQRGIRAIGTAADGVVRRVEAGPLTVGLLAFTQWRNTGEPGFAGRVTMLKDIDWHRVDDAGVDLLCAVPHWDLEFRHFPASATRALARKLIETGVGLIAGHHAHVVQPVERIGDALAAYGLGDFLGTALPRQPWPGRIGAILVADVSTDAATRGRIAGYELHFFLRVRQVRNERLVAAGALEGGIGRKVEARVAAVFGRDDCGTA
jgi:poly-gamma-glutamate capsule biosynthesis protein CapA/YwtB (metallophosphatase superfamily)